MKLDAFTRAFFEAALWSSTDESTPEGGEPMDRNYSVADIEPTCLATLVKECERFQADNEADLAARDSEQGGHDFWMTRCGHGVGFWETPDWPKDAGERLTEDSRRYGEVNLYVGDDGRIYAFGYEKGEREPRRGIAQERHSKRLGGG